MLKQLLSLTVFLLISVQLATLIFAQEVVTANLSSKDVVVGIGNISVINFTINNPTNASLIFSASIFGDYPKVIVVENNFVVPGNSSAVKPITFNPKEDIGRFSLTLYLESSKNGKNLSMPINLWVQHPDKYIMKNFESAVKNNLVAGKITVKPHDKLKTDFVFDILDINGKVIKSTELSQEIEKEETIENSIDVSDLSTGKYSLKVSIKGTDLSRSSDFDIGLSRSIKQDRKVAEGILYDEIEILLYNYGNLAENGYKVYEEIPKGSFVTLLTSSSDVIKSEKSVKYEFTIDSIRPGEVASIKYRIEKWQNLLIYLVGIVVVIAVLISLLFLNTKPKIRKGFSKASKGQYSIVLEVKNNGLSEMKDVVVRDFLQPAVKIKSADFGGLSPNIRSSQIGTELLWKLGNLKRGEIRILSYSIENLSAESLKLSTATINYTTGRKNRGVVRSNELTLQ